MKKPKKEEWLCNSCETKKEEDLKFMEALFKFDRAEREKKVCAMWPAETHKVETFPQSLGPSLNTHPTLFTKKNSSF